MDKENEKFDFGPYGFAEIESLETDTPVFAPLETGKTFEVEN